MQNHWCYFHLLQYHVIVLTFSMAPRVRKSLKFDFESLCLRLLPTVMLGIS